MTLGRAGGSSVGGGWRERSRSQARPGVTCYAGKGVPQSPERLPLLFIYITKQCNAKAFLFYRGRQKKKKNC